MTPPLNMEPSAAWLSARDRLTVVLAKASAHGVKISEREFRGKSLADDILSVRETIRALDGALARCEDIARVEAAVGSATSGQQLQIPGCGA